MHTLCFLELFRENAMIVDPADPKDYLLEIFKCLAPSGELLPRYTHVRKVYYDYVDNLQHEFEVAVGLLKEAWEKKAEEEKKGEERNYITLKWKEFYPDERRVFAKYAATLKKTSKMLFEMKKWGFTTAESFMGTIHYKFLEELLLGKTTKYLHM